MDKMLFDKAQHIISPYLNKETRVMDLYCGEDCYTKWIKRENNALLVPLSPKDMEHISHENPFIAYNNFINDNRKVPTKQGKADVVLLLGPLYDRQSEEKKRETLKEVKNLISPEGKVMTLRSCEANKPNSSNSFKYEEQNFDDAGFSVKEQQSLTKITENKEDKSTSENEDFQTGKSNYLGSEYYLTIATPKPVISCDALPPEVFVRTPVEIIQKYNITVLDDRKTTQDEEKDSNNDSDSEDIKDSSDNKKTEDSKNSKNNRCSNEVRQSINPSLQRKSVIKNSIDSTLFVTKKQEENKVVSYDLPILPTEITEQYNNSGKENKTENSNDLSANNSNKEISAKDNQNNNSNNELLNEGIKDNNSKKELFNKLADIDNSKEEVIEKNLWDIPPLPYIPIKPSIDKNLYVRKNNNDSSVRNNEKIDCKKVQQSIDKSLQIRIPKINPKYAKPKSKKKCIRNILR